MARKQQLTPKQARFCEEYLVDLNATAAAIRAGYRPKSARQTAAENLSKPVIVARVAELQAARSERTQVTVDMVVTELAKIAFSAMRDVADWSKERVSFKPSEDLTAEAAACVKDISSTREIRKDKYGETTENTNLKVVLHDKKGALELLGRHLGMFKDNLNIQTDQPIEVVWADQDQGAFREGAQ